MAEPEKTTRNNDVSTTTTLVDWDSADDPRKPYNWSMSKKILVTLASGASTFVVSFSSSAFAPARNVAAAQFGTSEVVMSLPVSLFLIGFVVGPLIFAPLSEIIGHAALLVIGIIGCGLFQVPFALAPNVGALLVSRFLQGALGSASLTVGTGMLAEVYDLVPRGVAVSWCACCMNSASALAPVVMSYVVADLTWRWIGWITLMLIAAVGAAAPFVLHETSPKIILLRKARRLRKETGNSSLVTKYSDDKVDFRRLVQRYLFVPISMLWTETILLILTLYMTFVWGTLYVSPRSTVIFQTHD
jgi:MFS transporter, DHA1 family, multidrug resistance protein